MPYRIIYCALSCASLLVAGQYNTLHHLGDDVVDSVTDDGLRAIVAKEPNVPILYFSQQEYEAAMQGLTGPEIDEAIRFRLKMWSPRAVGSTLSRVAEDERRVMTITAALANASQGSRARKLQEHFSSGLSLVTSITATGRLDRLSMTDLLSAIVSGETKLIAELNDPAEIAVHTRYAKALALELARLGSPDFAQALPYADPSHGVWVFPADEPVRNYLRARDLAAVPWRGGVVTTLTSRARQDFERRGNKVQVLYYDPGELLQQGSELTRAQMEHQFERLANEDDTARARRNEQYLDLLRLDIATQRGALRAQAASQDPGLMHLLDAQLAEETQILMRTCARNGTWLQGVDEPPSPERLLAAEQELTVDVSAFLELARSRKDAYLEQRLTQISDWKRADVNRLARSSER